LGVGERGGRQLLGKRGLGHLLERQKRKRHSHKKRGVGSGNSKIRGNQRKSRKGKGERGGLPGPKGRDQECEKRKLRGALKEVKHRTRWGRGKMIGPRGTATSAEKWNKGGQGETLGKKLKLQWRKRGGELEGEGQSLIA